MINDSKFWSRDLGDMWWYISCLIDLFICDFLSDSVWLTYSSCNLSDPVWLNFSLWLVEFCQILFHWLVTWDLSDSVWLTSLLVTCWILSDWLIYFWLVGFCLIDFFTWDLSDSVWLILYLRLIWSDWLVFVLRWCVLLTALFLNCSFQKKPKDNTCIIMNLGKYSSTRA